MIFPVLSMEVSMFPVVLGCVLLQEKEKREREMNRTMIRLIDAKDQGLLGAARSFHIDENRKEK
jgi:hypothetical protein